MAHEKKRKAKAKLLARLIARELVKEHTSTESRSAEEARREDIRVSAMLAGWDRDTGNFLIGAGLDPAEAARVFADALSRSQ